MTLVDREIPFGFRSMEAIDRRRALGAITDDERAEQREIVQSYLEKLTEDRAKLERKIHGCKVTLAALDID